MPNIIEMPKLGFDMTEGTLVKWVKQENETIEKGEVIAEIETDKATVEVESTFSGVVLKHLVKENSILPIGAPIAVIGEEGEAIDSEYLKDQIESAEEKEKKAAKEQVVTTEHEVMANVEGEQLIKASPLAKRMAREKGLQISEIQGTGPGNRVVKRDIERVLEKGTAVESLTVPEKPSLINRETRKIEISRLRSAIGKRMLESRQTIPDFTVTYQYDAGNLMRARKEMNEERPEEEKLSVNDFIIRSTALTLREFPNLNSSLVKSQLIQHGEINIGSAVAVENGLLIVVVKNADQKSLTQISLEMREMVLRVKNGKVRNEDMEGSTFTISNLGMFGVDDFVAIINPPEAAILAVGGAREAPVIQNGQMIIGWRMKATLSADHRITDGAEAAKFMQRLAVYLEQPWRLI